MYDSPTKNNRMQEQVLLQPFYPDTPQRTTMLTSTKAKYIRIRQRHVDPYLPHKDSVYGQDQRLPIRSKLSYSISVGTRKQTYLCATNAANK